MGRDELLALAERYEQAATDAAYTGLPLRHPLDWQHCERSANAFAVANALRALAEKQP